LTSLTPVASLMRLKAFSNTSMRVRASIASRASAAAAALVGAPPAAASPISSERMAAYPFGMQEKEATCDDLGRASMRYHAQS
jgi:hypothetical protein